MLRTVEIMPDPLAGDAERVIDWIQRADRAELAEFWARLNRATADAKRALSGQPLPGQAVRDLKTRNERLHRLRLRVQEEMGMRRDAAKNARVAAASDRAKRFESAAHHILPQEWLDAIEAEMVRYAAEHPDTFRGAKLPADTITPPEGGGS